MASITIDNLQPIMEYEELSGAELESVIGAAGGILLPLAAGALGGLAIVGAAVIARIAAGGR
jgi:hypothetical protein